MAALAVGAVCCPPAGAIVPGTTVVQSINDAPYQVAIVRHNFTDPYLGMWCGGSVRDSRHIITAAHCVFDNPLGASGQPVPPGAIDVVAGTLTLSPASGTRLPVESISIDDDYDPATFSHDAAVITLNGTLQLSPDTPITSIPLVDRDSWEAATPGSFATVTGWGRMGNGNYPRDLRTADVPIVGDNTCAPRYQGFDAPAMTCAGNDNVDSCFGDSGGALVVPQFGNPVPTPVMLGIVSFGPPDECGVQDYPGVYTEVYDDSITSYLQQPTPVSAPRTLTAPSVQGTVAVGSTVRCDPGTWEGAPAFSYQFVIPTAAGDVARTAQTAQSTYTIQPADAGSPLACNVKGKNAGGLAFAESAPVIVPVPSQQQAPVQPPTNQSVSQALQDTAAPVARVTKSTCTATRCTLSVSVSDAGFSAGIKTVQSSVRSTYRSRCKRKGKTVACTKTRTIKPSVAALTSTRFKVVASKLPYGTQRFTLVAIDKAGHRQALPTTKTVTTKKPKQKHR